MLGTLLSLFLVEFAAARARADPFALTTSRTWPACRDERYHNTTIYLPAALPLEENWQFEYSGHFYMVEYVLHAARYRFLRALQNKLDAQTLKDDEDSQIQQVRQPLRLERENYNNETSTGPPPVIRIHISTSEDALTHGVDESYRLVVVPTSKTSYSSIPPIRITAPTVFGAMHGLQTLLQLIDVVNPSKALIERRLTTILHDDALFAIHITPIIIHDAPTYPYRGLLIDTSRHYLPLKSIILENLDAMSMNKLNVLHWHLTDSSSWPYASIAMPELAQKGAYCRGCVYTLADIQRVVREAALRGIRVILEVDLPGHSQCKCECYVARNERSQ
jgi:N-acetyl-beta-hexosaminidase